MTEKRERRPRYSVGWRQLSLSINGDFIDEIDRRGIKNRSAYVEGLIRKDLYPDSSTRKDPENEF